MMTEAEAEAEAAAALFSSPSAPSHNPPFRVLSRAAADENENAMEDIDDNDDDHE